MKKLFVSISVLLIALLLVTNCTKNDSTEFESDKAMITIEKNVPFTYKQTDNSKLDLSNIVIKNMPTVFSNDDAIIIEHGDAEVRKSMFQKQLIEFLEDTKKDEYSEKAYVGIDFHVIAEAGRYIIYPEKVVFEKDIPNKSSGFSCPAGLELHKTCYTESCVQSTLETYGEVMESGDSFSVHHLGMRGVKICANSGLIQKANAYLDAGPGH